MPDVGGRDTNVHNTPASTHNNTMPLQLNNPSQVSSNIARMVTNMIPQIEEQMNGQRVDGNPDLPQTSRGPNPFLVQGRQRHSQHGRSQSASLGHGRSMSHGQAFYNAIAGQVAQGFQFNPTHQLEQPAQQATNAPSSQQQQTGNVVPAQQQQQLQGNQAANHNFVIDFGGDNGATLNSAPIQDSNNNGRGPSQANNPLSSLRSLWKSSEGSIPFILLLLVKILYDHRFGLLVLVCLFGTYYHANSCLKRQISQRDSHGVYDAFGNLVWIIAFLSANIIFVYYVFDDQKLYRSLFFSVPELRKHDIWNLLWIVGVSDFIIKYATIILKACVALLPKMILALKKKGKHYMLIEVTSQCYRNLIPVYPWLLFLMDTEHGGWIFANILCGTYILFKATQLYGKAQELRKTVAAFRLDVSYGTVPRREDLQSTDNCCPICQDKLTDPVKLSCTHIFCEDCVSMWFDREKTCPMCRAEIVDNPQWRDGNTTSSVVIF